MDCPPGPRLHFLAVQDSLEVVVADLSPESGGADAELLRSQFSIAVIFAEAGHEEVTVDVVALGYVWKERRWSGRFRVHGGCHHVWARR